MRPVPTVPAAARVLPGFFAAAAAEANFGRDATVTAWVHGLHAQPDPLLRNRRQAFVWSWKECRRGASTGFPGGECLQEAGNLEGRSAVALRVGVGGPFALYR